MPVVSVPDSTLPMKIWNTYSIGQWPTATKKGTGTDGRNGRYLATYPWQMAVLVEADELVIAGLEWDLSLAHLHGHQDLLRLGALHINININTNHKTSGGAGFFFPFLLLEVFAASQILVDESYWKIVLNYNFLNSCTRSSWKCRWPLKHFFPLVAFRNLLAKTSGFKPKPLTSHSSTVFINF